MASNIGVKYVPDSSKADGRLGTGSNLVWPTIPGLTLVPRPGAADSAISSSGGVSVGALTVDTSSLSDATSGGYYAAVLQASGGLAPYTWSKSGDLPTGLTLSSDGLLSGIPLDTADDYSVSYVVTDALGSTASQTITLTLAGLNPADLGNLVGWWKSYAGIASSPVGQWDDQSGNDYHLLAVGVQRPTLLADQLNGKPAVVFNGSDNVMQSVFAPAGLSQPATIYILFKQTTWVANRRIFDGVFTPDCFTLHQKTTTPNLAFYANNTLLQTTDLAENTWGIATVVANGASSLLQINKETADTGNPGNSAIDGFTLGALADFSLPGDIAVVEVILRSAADSADVRTAHQDYLAAVGGLTI